MAAHNELGRWGEEMAEEFLRGLGYVIRDRDWKSDHRDIDIVAVDGNELVFVEVKTRRSNFLVEPEQAVNYTKLRNLRTIMNHYVKFYHIDRPIRFDIITVIGNIGSVPQINHIKDVPILF